MIQIASSFQRVVWVEGRREPAGEIILLVLD